MKLVLSSIACFFVSLSAMAQDITVLQINAKWNISNNVELSYLPNDVNYKFAYLEEQPQSIKQQIKSVPTIIVFKENKAIIQWNADISFQLRIPREKVLASIKDVKETF